jgi:hypothetical protein
MSHYYLASPAQLQRALETHCARWEPEQARIFKQLLQGFLDSPVSIEERIRIDVKDPVIAHVNVAGDVPKEGS